MFFRWLLVGALGIYLAHRCMNYINKNEAVKKSFINLAIGILSARENFELRASIRQTWLNISELSSLKRDGHEFRAWFIVGEEPCRIPPYCRRNWYECSKWELDISKVRKVFYTSRENPDRFSPKSRDFHQGFSFQVNHPIVVVRLGVLHKVLPPGEEVVVSILDLQTKDTIVNTTLSRKEYDAVEHGFVYRNVENFLLPKEYQGLLLVEGYLNKEYNGDMYWDNNGGVITFSKVYISTIDAESVSFDGSLQVAPSIGFAVENISDLAKEVEECEGSSEEWNSYVSDVSKKLQAEKDQWSDILFVKIIDIYRNLPKKLLLFYDWIVPNYRFDFLLKTDDDCTVDIEKVLSGILERKLCSQELSVWSKFRSHWPVNYVGKWEDQSYRSPIYPTFPCGGGYVLSYRAVSWLQNNSAHLFPYQGEDVSLGIWMSAVNPMYIEDSNWECNDDCTINSYNRAQLSPEEMMSSWMNKLKCGNICHCDSERGVL